MNSPDEMPPQPPPLGPRPTAFTLVSIVSLGIAGGLGGLQMFAPDAAGKVPGMFGTVSSWISAGGIMGILSLLVWAQLGNRRIGVDEKRAANADKADVRDHYAEEVSALRGRLDEQAAKNSRAVAEIEGKYRRLIQETEKHYQALLHDSEHAHEECKRDRDLLRAEVQSLREELAGLRRQVTMQASDRVLALGAPGAEPPSEAVSGAAHRVRRHLGGRPRGADRGHKS